MKNNNKKPPSVYHPFSTELYLPRLDTTKSDFYQEKY